jgi:hypothetical protein
MEIHKPKLARNWREFAIEIGTIICGILIALGLDQTVEGLHRRDEVAEARKALRFEIARNANIALYNVEEERCRVGLLNLFVAWANGGGPRPQINIPPGLISQVTSTWDVVKVSAAAHMPLEERLAYSRFYDRVAAQGYLIGRQRDIGVQSVGLAARTTLTPADMQGALDSIAQQRLLGQLHGGNSAGIVQDAKAMGVDPDPIDADGRAALRRFCTEAGITPSPISIQ